MADTLHRLDCQPTLEGHLILVRPLRADDFDGLYAAGADPLVWEQHPDRERWREDVFRAYFDDHLASGGALAVVDRASGSLIGATRYANHDPNANEVEIGWTFLAQPYWGGAYNAELKKLMLEHAFQSVETVVFLVDANNRRSRRAVEKLGATESGEHRGMVLYA
ncbi:MAG TPA: GNAT family N-acetyltransferase, partial [Gaiellaceae bacterium]|nr:GNAT family N-acetyltransferase [Gaiellaceae bacterium]